MILPGMIITANGETLFVFEQPLTCTGASGKNRVLGKFSNKSLGLVVSTTERERGPWAEALILTNDGLMGWIALHRIQDVNEQETP